MVAVDYYVGLVVDYDAVAADVVVDEFVADEFVDDAADESVAGDVVEADAIVVVAADAPLRQYAVGVVADDGLAVVTDAVAVVDEHL